MTIATVVCKQGKMTPNGREGKMELRRGAKGTGKLLGAVTYWPWSGISIGEAEKMIIEVAEREEVTINWCYDK